MEKWGLKELQEHLHYLEKQELDRITMLSNDTKFEINLTLFTNSNRKKTLRKNEKNTQIEYLLAIYTKKKELTDFRVILKFIEEIKKTYENYLTHYNTDEELIEYFEKTLKWLMGQYFYLLPEKDKSVN